MNAARHGNPDTMFTIIDYVIDDRGFDYGLDLSGACMEIAILEDHLDVQKALVHRGIGPAWLTEDHTIMVQAMKAHRPELLEYMLSDAGRANWTHSDDNHVQNALPLYTGLLAYGHVPTWCQRIIYVFLQREDLSRIDLPQAMTDCILNMPRRNCGPECDVWLVKDRRLDREDMVDEIGILQHQGYAYLMDIE